MVWLPCYYYHYDYYQYTLSSLSLWFGYLPSSTRDLETTIALATMSAPRTWVHIYNYIIIIIYYLLLLLLLLLSLSYVSTSHLGSHLKPGFTFSIFI